MMASLPDLATPERSESVPSPHRILNTFVPPVKRTSGFAAPRPLDQGVARAQGWTVREKRLRVQKHGLNGSR